MIRPEGLQIGVVCSQMTTRNMTSMGRWWFGAARFQASQVSSKLFGRPLVPDCRDIS
jgi:hypothetical protein